METIKKINKYLVEHYPLIWNTRLVWMLVFALILHLSFFTAGFFAINTQEDVEAHYNLSDFYYDTPAVLIGSLLSVVSLLIWIIYYLKNNAFKNFYPLKKGTLFLQFCIVLLIFFTNITHYFSYRAGVTTKIKALYDWNEIDSDIKGFNNAAIFFLRDLRNYEIEAKRYPEPFPLEHEKTRKYLGITIDTTRAYFSYDGSYYQFFKVDTALVNSDIRNNIYPIEGTDDIDEEHNYRSTQPFKYRIVYDISAQKKLVVPNLYNFSDEFISYGQDAVANQNRLKSYQNLLDKKDENLLRASLYGFLNLAKKYDIKHNLNVEDWLHLINLKNDYQYIASIRDRKPQKYEAEKLIYNYYRLKTRIDTIPIPKFHNEKEQLYYSRFEKTSDGKNILRERQYEEYFKAVPFCDFGRLDFFFKNVYYTYHPKFDISSLYGFIVLSIFLALIIYVFKTTDIKNILLSIVTAAVILILGILLVYTVEKYLELSKASGIFIVLLVNIVLVLSSILGFTLKWNKSIVAILFSLAQFAVPLIILFSNLYYREILGYRERENDPFIQWFNAYGFWLVTMVWIFSIFLYSNAIRKWRAWTE